MIRDIIDRIKNDLVKTFAEIDDWFAVNSLLLDYTPQNGGWTIRQILEHISLTNYYLLILIRKGTRKALAQANREGFVDVSGDYDLDWNKLISIGKHNSFTWNRPEHMEPTCQVTMHAVREKLTSQLHECLNYLNQMPNGEGILYKTTMTVNNLGKIDVYHYISFLAQHGRRHITQMEKIKAEMEKESLT